MHGYDKDFKMFSDASRIIQVLRLPEREQCGHRNVGIWQPMLTLHTVIGNALAGRANDIQTSLEKRLGDIFFKIDNLAIQYKTCNPTMHEIM